MNWHPGAIAAHEPDRLAVVFSDARLTYGALDAISLNFAAQFYGAGMQQGDVAALLIGNRPEFFSAAWGAQRCGLYYVPIPTRLTPSEIAYILADSGAKVLIVDPDYAERAEQAVKGLQIKILGIYPPPLSLTPPALEGGDMLYTSGTTGKPKGVRRPLGGEALGSDSRRVERARTLFGLGRDSVFLSPAPLYHAAPLRFTMNLLRTGGTVVGMSKFEPSQALEHMERFRVTHSQWVPTMFSRLLELPIDIRNQFNLITHKVAIHAGAPCAPDLKHRMINWWGPILHEYYSGTESVGFTHITTQEWLTHPGSVGKPYGCAVHILGDDGAELVAGETGTVYFEGKAGLAYHNDPAKTALAHDARGWSTMGDIGYLDGDGYLFLTDRRAFTIISGGVNIYPAEVEAAFSGHPAVRDIAVFGVPDADFGESVFALIEISDTALADIALAYELADFARQKLASFKLPRRIAFGSVERTETGKVRKALLRERHITVKSGFAITGQFTPSAPNQNNSEKNSDVHVHAV